MRRMSKAPLRYLPSGAATRCPPVSHLPGPSSRKRSPSLHRGKPATGGANRGAAGTQQAAENGSCVERDPLVHGHRPGTHPGVGQPVATPTAAAGRPSGHRCLNRRLYPQPVAAIGPVAPRQASRHEPGLSGEPEALPHCRKRGRHNRVLSHPWPNWRSPRINRHHGYENERPIQAEKSPRPNRIHPPGGTRRDRGHGRADGHCAAPSTWPTSAAPRQPPAPPTEETSK